METLQERILRRFLDEIAATSDIEAEVAQQLRQLFAQRKKVKADDLAKILSSARSEDL